LVYKKLLLKFDQRVPALTDSTPLPTNGNQEDLLRAIFTNEILPMMSIAAIIIVTKPIFLSSFDKTRLFW
jgi:hypothetical protein